MQKIERVSDSSAVLLRAAYAFPTLPAAVALLSHHFISFARRSDTPSLLVVLSGADVTITVATRDKQQQQQQRWMAAKKAVLAQVGAAFNWQQELPPSLASVLRGAAAVSKSARVTFTTQLVSGSKCTFSEQVVISAELDQKPETRIRRDPRPALGTTFSPSTDPEALGHCEISLVVTLFDFFDRLPVRRPSIFSQKTVEEVVLFLFQFALCEPKFAFTLRVADGLCLMRPAMISAKETVCCFYPNLFAGSIEEKEVSNPQCGSAIFLTFSPSVELDRVTQRFAPSHTSFVSCFRPPPTLLNVIITPPSSASAVAGVVTPVPRLEAAALTMGFTIGAICRLRRAKLLDPQQIALCYEALLLPRHAGSSHCHQPSHALLAVFWLPPSPTALKHEADGSCLPVLPVPAQLKALSLISSGRSADFSLFRAANRAAQEVGIQHQQQSQLHRLGSGELEHAEEAGHGMPRAGASSHFAPLSATDGGPANVLPVARGVHRAFTGTMKLLLSGELDPSSGGNGGSKGHIAQPQQQRKAVRTMFSNESNAPASFGCRPKPALLSAAKLRSVLAACGELKCMRPPPAQPPASPQVTREQLHGCQCVAQVDRKFIFAVANDSSGGTLLCVDQHAAHERVRLEQLLRDVELYTSPSPLDPHTEATLTPPALVHLVRRLSLSLKHWGWTFNASGEVILSCPVVELEGILCRLSDPAHLAEAVEAFDGAGGALSCVPPPIVRFCVSRSCRGAIMFGDPLENTMCQALLNEIPHAAQFRVCSHGRNSLIALCSLPLSSISHIPLPSLKAIASLG